MRKREGYRAISLGRSLEDDAKEAPTGRKIRCKTSSSVRSLLYRGFVAVQSWWFSRGGSVAASFRPRQLHPHSVPCVLPLPVSAVLWFKGYVPARGVPFGCWDQCLCPSPTFLISPSPSLRRVLTETFCTQGGSPIFVVHGVATFSHALLPVVGTASYLTLFFPRSLVRLHVWAL